MSKEGQVSLSRSDLVNYIATKNDCTVAVADEKVKQVLTGIIEVIQEKVSSDQPIFLSLVKFGTFKVRKSPARKCRNPKTGETIDVPARDRLSFQPSKDFKKILEK